MITGDLLKKSTHKDLDESVSLTKKNSRKKECIADLSEDDDEEEKITRMQKIGEIMMNLQTISLRDKIFFVQNLRIMIKGGLSLAEALRTISIQVKNSLFVNILKKISKEVESGVSFAESLKKYPKVFNNLFVNMIESGEISGNLEGVLEKLHTQMKRDHDLIAKVKGAMVYPAVVVVAMVGIGAAMMVFVVPKLMGIFDEFNAELPLPTRVLIGVSRFVTHNGLVVVIGIIIFVFLFIKFYRSKTGIRFWHKFYLIAPVISPIVKKINLARFCRTTSSLLKTNISIVKTFEITSMVVGNYYYRRSLKEASKKITKGVQINKVLAKNEKLFPPTIIQMIKVGEESGSVDETLDEVAQFYEEDVNQVMETLPSIIEPILILILGLGVGIMAVAIILPMYSLGQSI